MDQIINQDMNILINIDLPHMVIVMNRILHAFISSCPIVPPGHLEKSDKCSASLGTGVLYKLTVITPINNVERVAAQQTGHTQ